MQGILVVFLLISTSLWAAEPSPFNHRIEQALEKENAGDYEAAQKIYEEILKEDAGHIPALFGLAEVHYWLGNYNKSLENYQRLLDLQPDHLEAMIGISKVYLALGQQAKANEYLRKAESLDPENEEVEALSTQTGQKTRIRIRGGYVTRDLSYFGDPSQTSYSEIEVSKEKRYGFGLRTTYIRQFNLNGFDTALFGNYWFQEKTKVDLGFSFAPKVAILPTESVTAGIAHTVWKVTPEIHYTFENYQQADQHHVEPALFFEVASFLRAGGGYEYRRLVAGANTQNLHSGFGKVQFTLKEWLSLNGFYARVQRGFEGGRPGNAFVQYSAHQAGGGFAVNWMENTLLSFDAYTEQRNNGEDVASYTLELGIVF